MKNSKGFLQLIVIIAIALIIIGYFGLNIKDILAKPVVHDNLVWFWNLLKDLWTNYLQGAVMWLWDHVGAYLWELIKKALSGFTIK